MSIEAGMTEGRCAKHDREQPCLPCRVEGLTAGPELNAKVAEKVMGWPEYRHGMPNMERQFVVAEGNPTTTITAPRFSTDIEAAWEVVEKLREQFMVTIDLLFEGCVVTIDNPGREGHWRVALDPREGDVSLAICLAALKAVNHG